MGVNDGDFVFYTINEWTSRKGIEDLIHAFLQTFEGNQKVVRFIE
jgi:hypothetical protein